MTYQQKIIKKCFSFSKKSKIVCAIERSFLWMLIAFVTTLGICFWFYSFAPKPANPLFVEYLKQMLIIFTVPAFIIGFVSGLNFPNSLFVWRLFKPDEESIRKYIESEKKRIREAISSNKAYIQKLESNTEIEIAEIEQENSNLESEFQEVQSVSYLQAVLLN